MLSDRRLAQIVDSISREVYSFKRTAKRDRLAAAERYGRALHEWRKSLPPHLGSVRPKSLMPAFRREATALRLAYCHAIMHANRLFLWGGGVTSQQQRHAMQDTETGGGRDRTTAQSDSVLECISAAKMALGTVDDMVADGTVFHALWWTPYVTFCALAVVYVWELQQQALGQGSQSGIGQADDGLFAGLFELAERCHGHLARATAADSPSQRYSVILEELRLEARQRITVQPSRNDHAPWMRSDGVVDQLGGTTVEAELNAYAAHPSVGGAGHLLFDASNAGDYGAIELANGWQMTDWLDLDSLVSCTALHAWLISLIRLIGIWTIPRW